MRLDADGVYSGSAGGSAHLGAFEASSSDAFWRRDPTTSKKEKRAEKRAQEEKIRKERESLEKFLQQLADSRKQMNSALHAKDAGMPVSYPTKPVMSLFEGLI